jgi:hypothetical protein
MSNRLAESDSALEQGPTAHVFQRLIVCAYGDYWERLGHFSNHSQHVYISDVQSLADEGRSLSICLLAQFLLNGEIIA